MSASEVMWTISRVRLDRIGPSAARFLDVTLDFRDAAGLPLDTIVWLRNGGGKSTVLSLICALVRPYRRDFLATAATGKHLEDYVLGADTAHVVVEWSGPQGRRLVTGAVYEWADRTQPADPNRDHDRLNARWYLFSPAQGRAELDALPFTTADGPASLKDFAAAVRDLDAIPGCRAAVTDRADRWRGLLDDNGLDPEIFTPILQMNATEGGIEGQFQFRGADQFVQYLLELIVDPEVPGQVATILEEVRAGLAERPALLADLAFAEEASPRLRELAAARDERDAAVAAQQRHHAAAGALAAALAASVAAADLEQEADAADVRRHEQEAADHGDAVERAGRAGAGFRRRAARLRLETAATAATRCREEEVAAAGALAAWRATPAVQGLRAAQQRASSLEVQLATATMEAEPLRDRRDRAAAGYAAVLEASIDAVDEQVAQLRADAEADDEQERAARTRGEEARDDRARLTAALDAARESLAALDRDLAAAATAGHLRTGEPVPAAIRRHTDADAAAVATAAALEADRRDLLAERRTLQERAAELVTRRHAAERDRDLAADRGRQLRDAVAELAADERLRALGGGFGDGAGIDPVAESGDLADALSQAIARTERRRIELAVEGAEDERALAALDSTGLLPGSLDLVRARDALEGAGIAAATGWGYLADAVPAARRTAVLRAAPALASGLLVHDERDLPAARKVLLDAGLRPTSAVVLATTADLAAVDGPSLFVVPPAPALIDRAATGDELTARERARAERSGTDAGLAADLVRDTDLLRRVHALRAECPPGTVEDLAAREAAADARLTAVDAEATRVAADATDLAERETALDDARTAAEQVRRTAAAALGTLAGLASREQDAAEQRERVAALPAEIADCARTVAAENEAETNHRRLAAAALDHANALGHTAEAQRADRAALGDVTDPPSDPPASVGDARAAWETARAAYDREVSGSALASSLDEALRALGRAREQVGELPPDVRTTARELLDTADGLDASARSSATTRADGVLAQARATLADAEAEVRVARADLEQHHGSEPENASGTREDALAAAAAADREAGEHRVLREEALAAVTGVTAAQAVARERATAMRHLGELLGVEPDGAGDAPFNGSSEDARAAVDEARSALDAAVTGAVRARRAVENLTQDAALWAAEDRFSQVKPAVRDRFRVADDLLDEAERLAGDLDLLAENLRGRLEDLDEHKGVVVTAMVGMVRQALKSLQRAQALSELPESLGEWAGQRFLDVGPRAAVQTSDLVLRDRCARLVDGLATRGVPVPRGHELLWQATSAVVGEGNWKARVLKPSTTFAVERVSVERMRKWSGGEKVTISLLLFCMVAKLRASSRGRDQPGLGALPLDNPLGKANYVVFLNLQRKVAAANGIQLIFLTGVGDMKAVGRFPNVIRMRNTRTRSREYVSIAEREVATADPVGVVDTTRVWREDPVLTLL